MNGGLFGIGDSAFASRLRRGKKRCPTCGCGPDHRRADCLDAWHFTDPTPVQPARAERFKTVTVTHEGELFTAHQGYWFAFCRTCGWTSDHRVTESRAERDLELHQLAEAEE